MKGPQVLQDNFLFGRIIEGEPSTEMTGVVFLPNTSLLNPQDLIVQTEFPTFEHTFQEKHDIVIAI